MTMAAVLGKLVEEGKSKCEEAQRKALMNLSALAAMASMRSASDQAVALYEQAAYPHSYPLAEHLAPPHTLRAVDDLAV